MSEPADRLEALERELDELRRQEPKHTPRPSWFLRIEELEDEIAKLRAGTGDD